MSGVGRMMLYIVVAAAGTMLAACDLMAQLQIMHSTDACA